ncbi:MAG TPA: hypothetical protein VKU00_22130, partial [Chthonomonadaceae bacterium]|nr:hypothetical protein [Chthonomonadaceae bacterium]
AILNDKNWKRAEKLLNTLLENGDLELAGMMLADGVGTTKQMQNWADSFAALLSQEWPTQIERCLRAWQASQQEERRSDLVKTLNRVAEEAHWLAWLRMSRALIGIGTREDPLVKYPESALQAPIAVLLREREAKDRFLSAKQFAGARALSGLTALWPSYPTGLLHLWPSERRRLALHLQRQASLGATRHELEDNIIRLHAYRKRHGEATTILVARTLALARYLARDHDLDLDRALAHDLDFDHDHDSDLARDRDRALDRDRDRALARDLDLARALDRDLDLARALARDRALDRALGRDRARDRDRDRALDLARYHNSMTILLLRTVSLRSSLCWFLPPDLRELPDRAWPLGLLIPAARISVTSGRLGRDELEAGIHFFEEQNFDPFWIAFARHIARLSTPEDWAFLEDLAAHPEKRKGLLAWGLQYIVRGDILLPDDTEVTLDELCRSAGVPLYPLLEEMPPEIEPN